MAFPTPPSSARKQNAFMEPSNKLAYYEDYYGERNVDEEFDRFPDKCEDESSTEDDTYPHPKKSDVAVGFFKTFATPKGKDRPGRQAYDRFGEISKTRKGTQNFFKQFNDNKSGFTDDVGSSLSATPNLFEKFKESKSLSNNGSAQDKGSPSINRKDSIAANQKKMRTLKKFADFDAEMGQGEGVTNTAGEAMDDLLRSGSLDNLDDSFPTLDEDANSSEYMAGDTYLFPPTSGTQSAFDGDVEDNTSETSTKACKEEEQTSKHEGKKATGGVIAVRNNKVQKPVAPTTARRSKRQEEIEKAKKAAEKQAGRRVTRTQDPKTKAAELMARNRNKMTARATTLRTKAKKKAAKTLSGGSASKITKGTSVETFRNWEGEEIEANGGIVVVLTDEANPKEYVRY